MKSMAKVKRCECGRPWSDCIYVVQRTTDRRYLYYRCIGCYREWTVTELVDPVVSTEEIIEVHELLKGDITISELVK